mmetsp:Transcript_48168/g.54583  ORF Transcript_48168/g.54583 Transcript_48168/m.54583 type:complete len:123 (-) Transcript_48168:883-1251(-)
MSKFSRASSSHKKRSSKIIIRTTIWKKVIGGSMMYATTMVTASAELDAIMQSATMLTAGLSKDETAIYAKNLENSDEYDEGYEGGNDRSFDELFYQKNGKTISMMLITMMTIMMMNIRMWYP